MVVAFKANGGEELYFDSTKVQANAAIDRLMPRVEWESQQHVHELFEKKVDPEEIDSEDNSSTEEDPLLADNSNPEPESAKVLTPQELVEKYDGSRMTGIRKPSYERLTDQKVCPTDPDASPMQPSGGGSSVMGYRDHYIQEELDRVKAYQAMEVYQKAMRKRSLWTEPLFGEVKQFHQLRQFRLRGLKKVNIEGVMGK